MAAIPKKHKTIRHGLLGSWWDFILLPTSLNQIFRGWGDINNQMLCASSGLKPCKISQVIQVLNLQ